ncbi:WW domain protein [Thermoascus aurantiacus ATCC 26904]
MAANPPPNPEDRLPSEEKEVTDTKSSPDTPAEEAKEEVETQADRQEQDNTSKEKETQKSDKDKKEEGEAEGEAPAPPLPDENPPLPDEAPPGQVEDDGWEAIWDPNSQAYYFYNRFTGVSQWENPRVPDAPSGPVGEGTAASSTTGTSDVAGGYNPKIHGDYDPTAPYAQKYEQQYRETTSATASAAAMDPSHMYTATAAFNRFTGKWQPMSLTPERYSAENKARRQLHAYFDVDAAANSHDGRSLKAERSARKLSKKELKMFKEKRRERKEEKRRAWLRD